jgi:hypothetical protein
MGAKRRWSELSEGQRRMILCGVAIEGALKMAALRDLKRRPAAQVRGSKRAWVAFVLLANSVGAVPLAYFLVGRRRQG